MEILEKGLKRWLKGKRDDKREEDRSIAIAEYQNLLNQFVDELIKYNFGLSAQSLMMYFSDYDRFFFDAKKNICCNDANYGQSKTMLIISKNNLQNLCDKFAIPLQMSPRLVQLVELLRVILQLRKELGDVWVYSRFKFRNNIATSIFDNPNLFYLFDDNLFLKQCLDNNGEQYVFLYENNYRGIFSNLNQPIPTKKEFQAIKRLIKTC